MATKANVKSSAASPLVEAAQAFSETLNRFGALATARRLLP